MQMQAGPGRRRGKLADGFPGGIDIGSDFSTLQLFLSDPRLIRP